MAHDKCPKCGSFNTGVAYKNYVDSVEKNAKSVLKFTSSFASGLLSKKHEVKSPQSLMDEVANAEINGHVCYSCGHEWSKTESTSDEMQCGFIKCPKCGEEYAISMKETEAENFTHKCEKCGNSIQIAFITRCSICGKDVALNGDTWKDVMKEVGSSIIKGINPLTNLKDVKYRFDKEVPYPHGMGDCPFCSTKYARCPNCHTGVEIDPTVMAKDTIFCTECGQKFRIDSVK